MCDSQPLTDPPDSQMDPDCTWNPDISSAAIWERLKCPSWLETSMIIIIIIMTVIIIITIIIIAPGPRPHLEPCSGLPQLAGAQLNLPTTLESSKGSLGG